MPAEEYSAGGVVTRNRKVLLVKVQNLKGDYVWTFPKGHVEGSETPRMAALREVLEETGYDCEVLCPLTVVSYRFTRNGKLVKKKVRWYRMAPKGKTGTPDAAEVFAVRWTAADEARRRLRYPGDFRLLELIEKQWAKNTN